MPDTLDPPAPTSSTSNTPSTGGSFSATRQLRDRLRKEGRERQQNAVKKNDEELVAKRREVADREAKAEEELAATQKGANQKIEDAEVRGRIEREKALDKHNADIATLKDITDATLAKIRSKSGVSAEEMQKELTEAEEKGRERMKEIIDEGKKEVAAISGEESEVISQFRAEARATRPDLSDEDFEALRAGDTEEMARLLLDKERREDKYQQERMEQKFAANERSIGALTKEKEEGARPAQSSASKETVEEAVSAETVAMATADVTSTVTSVQEVAVKASQAINVGDVTQAKINGQEASSDPQIVEAMAKTAQVQAKFTKNSGVNTAGISQQGATSATVEEEVSSENVVNDATGASASLQTVLQPSISSSAASLGVTAQKGGGSEEAITSGMSAELVNFSSPFDDGRIQATRFTAGEADAAVPPEQSPAKAEKQEKEESKEGIEKKEPKKDEEQGKPSEQAQAAPAKPTQPGAKTDEKEGMPQQAAGAANQAAPAGEAPSLPDNAASPDNAKPEEGGKEEGKGEGQPNAGEAPSGDEGGAAPEKGPEQLPSGGGGPQGGAGPAPQPLPSGGASGGGEGAAGGGAGGGGGVPSPKAMGGGAGGAQKSKGQQGPTEAELREQQKNEEDSNFDLILLTILIVPAILLDIVCIIPVVAEVVGTGIMPVVRFLFWLLDIRPGRLIENLINRIIKQQAEGAAGSSVPLPKETGIALRAVFNALFVSLTAVRLIPFASEVSFSATIFIFTTYVLCKAEERVIKKLKDTLRVAGAIGRVVAKLPIPQAKAIGGAVAAADDVVNKGTPAGQAVQQEMSGAIPGAGGAAAGAAGGASSGMGVGQQVGVGQQGATAAAAGSGGAGAQGSPLMSGTPMFTDTKSKAGTPVDGIQGPAPRQPKSEFARAKQRMRMQPRLQKRIRRKYGLPEDDDAYVSGARDEILDEGIKATEGDGGRFAKEKPTAGGSPIAGADSGTPNPPPLGK